MPEIAGTICPHCGAPRLGNGRPVTITQVCDYFNRERHWVTRKLLHGLGHVGERNKLYNPFDVLERWNALQQKDRDFSALLQRGNSRGISP